MIFLLPGFAPAAGCAIDERVGKALADALANGPIRDYASAQADVIAQTSFVLVAQVAPGGGGPDFPAAQQSFYKARAAYDRGVAGFLVVAPDLDFQLDGKADDVFARTGLGAVEQALFSRPPGSPAELTRLTQKLSDAALILHQQVPDPARPLTAADLLGSMSAVAAQLATKFDGSASPYAGASLLSLANNLTGLQAIYAILSPLVRGAQPELDQQLTGMLADLLAQVQALTSLDAVTDKTQYLRQCADLAQAFTRIGPALQLSVSTINLS